MHVLICGVCFNSYLIAAMGLQVLWSFSLACLDIHALRVHKDLHSQLLLSLVVVGDWVRSFSFNIYEIPLTEVCNRLKVFIKIFL